jgi:hypothetical protein
MFGMRQAHEAQSAAAVLTARFEAHDRECTRRYEELRHTLGEQNRTIERTAAEQRAARTRLLWWIIAILGTVLASALKDVLPRIVH